MKFLFLVTSSIIHFNANGLSAYSEDERFQQTLNTIDSIRIRVPNSYIVLSECSYLQLKKDYRDILIERCDLFLEYYNEPGIIQLYDNLRFRKELLVYGKSLLETRCLLNTMRVIKNDMMFNGIQRIFKITGRYLLNEYFNISDYESSFLNGKYVIKTYTYSNNDFQIFYDNELKNIYAALYGFDGMMLTGLWSFDLKLFNETYECLNKAFIYMQKMIQYTSGIDVEHSLYKFLDKNHIITAPVLGVTVIKGMLGDNGGIYKV